jgi:hypothetical protein
LLFVSITTLRSHCFHLGHAIPSRPIRFERGAASHRHGEPAGQEEGAGDGRRPRHPLAQDAAPQAHAVPEAARDRHRAREGGRAGACSGEAEGPRIDRLEEEEGAGGSAQAGRCLAHQRRAAGAEFGSWKP